VLRTGQVTVPSRSCDSSSSVADERMPPHSLVADWSLNGFQIRTHHIGNTANLGILPEIVGRAFTRAPTFTQGFQRHIQPDLVAILKTVCHRLGGIGYLHGHAVEHMRFHACRKSATGKAHNPDGKFFDAGRTYEYPFIRLARASGFAQRFRRDK